YAPAGLFDVNSGRCLHSTRVPERHYRRLLPRIGAHHGCGPAHLPFAGADSDTFTSGLASAPSPHLRRESSRRRWLYFAPCSLDLREIARICPAAQVRYTRHLFSDSWCGSHTLLPAGIRVSPAHGRGRLRYRLLHRTWHKSDRDEPRLL